jgi:hypothetical protein
MLRTAAEHIATAVLATAFPEFQNPKARMQNVQRHLRASVTIDATEPVSVSVSEGVGVERRRTPLEGWSRAPMRTKDRYRSRSH